MPDNEHNEKGRADFFATLVAQMKGELEQRRATVAAHEVTIAELKGQIASMAKQLEEQSQRMRTAPLLTESGGQVLNEKGEPLLAVTGPHPD